MVTFWRMSDHVNKRMTKISLATLYKIRILFDFLTPTPQPPTSNTTFWTILGTIAANQEPLQQ
jgi:hypothetical protein